MPIPILGAVLSALGPVLLPSVTKRIVGDQDGTVAQAAITMVEQVAGIPIRSPEDAAAAAAKIQGDPALALQLARQQDQHQAELMALHNDNTANARAMHVARSDRTPAVLAYATTILVAVAVIYTMWDEVQDNPISMMLLGSLMTAWGSIINFFFGSSVESRDGRRGR
ncbi:MAG: hypothetical protein RLY86_130 [Pseudomonadota bacterium]|jgi:hypothetical protein